MTTTKNAQVIRAACYCRISSDPKDKREGVTRQREDTAILCQLKGWEIADVYVDNDRSASNGKSRPEWERLLADIEAGKIDAVAAFDQDRVNRTMEDFIGYKKVFVRHRTLLATTNAGDIDLSTPTGVLTATIKTAVSEHEVEMMKIRMRRAARQKAEKGKPMWRRAFGYLDTPAGPVPDPKIAPLIREAYSVILAGAALSEVCRMWNEAGALTQRWVAVLDENGDKVLDVTGRPVVECQHNLWTQPQVSNFLRKPRNAGLRSHTDTAAGTTEIVGKGTWEPIVDESVWRAAQEVLNAPGRKPGRKTVRRHLMTGVLWCGKCGHHLSGCHTYDKKITYRCAECHGVSVRAEFIEPLVIGLVGDRLSRKDAVDLLKSAGHSKAGAKRLRDEKAALYAEIEQLGVERALKMLTASQVQAATAVLQRQIDVLEQQEIDQERVRVFDGIPLGTKGAIKAVEGLSSDRLRAVLSVLMKVTIAATGKRGKVFNPDRVQVEWL